MSTRLHLSHRSRILIVTFSLLIVILGLAPTNAAPHGRAISQDTQHSGKTVYDVAGNHTFIVPDGVTPLTIQAMGGNDDRQQGTIFLPFTTGGDGNPSTPAVSPTKAPTPEPTEPSIPDVPTGTILRPIGNQQASLGATLRIELAPENSTDLIFDVAPLPLPKNATLNAKTGIFLFTPSPEQIGSFTFTFTAMKGSQEQSETVTITVPQPNTNAATALRGRILDANKAEAGVITPIVGATVSHIESGNSVTTDADGYFELSGLEAGEQYFEFDGATANPTGTYGAYRSQQMLIANVVNAIERPIYIMAIDTAGQTMVDPNQETVVTNPNINTTIEIPPNTVMDDGGNEYSGPISVSEVPDDFTPSSLPDTLDPGMVLTIQPMGLTFDEPAPITFPNFDNLPPRSVVDIWSMDHETSQFFVAGKGRVSNDGSVIESFEGGIRESSWHFPLPPPFQEGPPPEDTNDNEPPPGTCFTSTVSLADGCLQTLIELPAYVSQGQARGLTFVYNSQRAYPQPIFSLSADMSEIGSPIPNQLSYSLTDFGGLRATIAETYLDVASLNTRNRRFRAATTIDGTTLETATWPYTMRVNQYFESSTSAAEFNDRKIIVNGKDSPFGVGWDMSGLQRIYPQQDGNLLLTNGDGSARVFDAFDIGLASLEVGRTLDFSLASGDTLADARAAIGENFSEESISHIGVSTISARHLRHADILFASTRRQSEFLEDNVITPLTKVEQDALLEFVRGGGCAIIMVSDNLGDDELPTVNQSLVNAFGMTVGGNNSPNGGLAITDPSASPITNGPFGDVAMMNWSIGIIGGITDLGPHAKSLASSPIGSALAVIEPNAISPGSGGVVVFTNSFIFDSGSFFTRNQALFLNTLNFCVENIQQSVETHYDGPNGDFTRITKAADGSFTRYMKDGSVYHYNDNGLQTSMVDRNSNTTTYTYDAEVRLTQITDPVGKITTLSYEGKHLESVTDPTGRITQFTHDNAGNLTQVTLPDNTTQSFGYDARHLMTTETDRRSQLVQRVFDDQGRIKSASLPDNVNRELTYSLSSGLSPSNTGTENNPAVVILESEVSSTTTDGEGRITSYQLGPMARPSQITDPNGLMTTIQRDDDGNPTRITTPSRGDAWYVYDAEGNVIKYTDESWNVNGNEYSYDSLTGAVTSVTDWYGYTSQFSYDDSGNLVQARTPLGRDVTLTYDDLGLPQTLIDTLDTESRFSYDDNGNPTQISIGMGPNVRSTLMSYTPEGYVQAVTDPIGRSYGFAYDPMGRLTSEMLPGGRTVVYAYDGEGNLTNITPPGQPAHLFEYDGLGQVTAYVPPSVNGSGNTRTTYSYNKAQQLTRVIRPDGKEISYHYDDGGRLTEQMQPRGSIMFDYGLLAIQLHTVSAPDDVILRYSYNGDRIDGVTWQGPVAGYVGTDLRPDGVLEKYVINVEQGGPQYIRYKHDADDAFVEAGNLQLSYEEASGLLSTTALSNLSDERQYNAYGEVATYKAIHDGSTPIYQTSYLYDSLGRITTVTETVQGLTKTLAYGYDDAGRLQSVSENGILTASYIYDANGNRLTGPDSAIGTYDAQDRLLIYGNTSYTYTANGELLTKTTGNQATTYDYDVMGNLMGVTLLNGTEITYLVDGQDRRIGKKVNGSLQYGLLYKDQLNPIAKLDSNGNIEHLYIYGSRLHVPDYISAESEDNTTVRYRLITDHLGSVRMVVNAQTGEVVQEMAYAAWGDVIKDTNPGFQPFGFAGGLYDPDTGLVRFGARDYDAEVGRWTTKDPVGHGASGPNLYNYVFEDPVNYIDPPGLARFGKRPLNGSPISVDLGTNSTLDNYNRELVHEQIFFDDGKYPDNLGFFGTGEVRPDDPTKIGEYQYDNTYYYDSLLREAVNRVGAPTYCLLTFNCQHWAERVREEYRKLEELNRYQYDQCPIPQ
ncbi:MAG: RHS repeat-associated core domain-containing protein [Chloroflexota bacterium]